MKNFGHFSNFGGNKLSNCNFGDAHGQFLFGIKVWPITRWAYLINRFLQSLISNPNLSNIQKTAIKKKAN
jgi:hypothetical protein